MLKVGVLALQGSFEKHIKMLESLNVLTKYVKYKKDLDQCSGLIIPGGESTTISKLIFKNKLYNSLKEFSDRKPVFGTCAGLVMLSSFKNQHIKSLNKFNINIERNGWGRQIKSFSSNVKISFLKNTLYKGVFIRAPKIININDQNIQILGKINNKPALIKKNNNLGSTFHPELTSDNRIHKYFIEMINAN